MELTVLDSHNGIEIPNTNQVQAPNAFIEANTIDVQYTEVKKQHIVPVFSKNNEPAISHCEFIDVVNEAATSCFGNSVAKPVLRISHPIKGRIPEAIHKSAKELMEHEKTIYYERMAFMVELDNVYQNINGNQLKLTVGGVKAFNQDNLYGNKGAGETFHLFIGFQNKVCTNLCIWTDGLKQKVKVKSLDELYQETLELFHQYDAVEHLSALAVFTNKSLTERQFALLLGRARLYNHLPNEMKREIPPLLFSDTQVGTIAKGYYSDEHFPREADGAISLWNMYNLFTGSNKSSYIDGFLPKGQNSFDFVRSIQDALDHGQQHWFLN